MTYQYRILNDRPLHFYPLSEEIGGFDDAAGGSAAQVNGTPVSAPPLVVGGGNAFFLTGNDNFRFSSPVFHEENVARPFALEAWFKPVSVSGVKGVVGHLGTEDGLTFDGEKVHFTTSHGAAGLARASYTLPTTSSSYHLVGVHTSEKNELYVNGVRVASVNITQEQALVNYDVPQAPGYLYVGHRPGSIIVDSVAVYAYALPSRTVKLHFLWGKDVPDFRDIIGRRSGKYWTFTDHDADVSFNYLMNSAESWNRGQSASVRIVNDVLVPALNDGLTVQGSWIGGFILSSVSDAIDGSKIEWLGQGNFTVETSLDDGATWQSAVNGREVAGIVEGYTPGDRSLTIRVNFPAGLEEVPALTWLSVKLYNSRDSIGNDSTLLASPLGRMTLASDYYQPIDNNDRMGAYLYEGSLSVPVDSERVIDLWFNIESLQDGDYLFDARPNSNVYLYWNGMQWTGGEGTLILDGETTSLGAMNIGTGRWHHLVILLPNPLTTLIVLGANSNRLNTTTSRIGLLTTYPDAMTEEEAKTLYKEYLGVPISRVVEATGLRIGDSPATTVKIYSYDWSVIGSG